MGQFFTGSASGGSATSGKIGKGVQTNLLSLLDPNQRAKGLGAFSLDPNQFKSINASLGQYSDPNYLDVANNPYAKNLISALTDNSNTNVSQQLAGLRSQFATQGQTGTNTASPLAETEGQTITQSSKDLNNIISQQLFGQLQSQQGLQLQGLSAENIMNLLPANLVAQLAPLLAKNKGATPSPLTSIGQLAEGLGGAAKGGAGLAMLCWVARAVYGKSNPRWIKLRRWMINKAPSWLLNLYLKQGERFANWLNLNEWAKPPVKWAMDLAIGD